VTVYVVDVHQLVHTCPADRRPHPFATYRTVVEVIPAGPCLTPITLPGTDTTVDCKARRHHHEQCDNCRITVQVRTVTTTRRGASRATARRAA